MKDSFHAQPEGLIMTVNGGWVLGSVAGPELLSRSQQRLEDLIAQRQKSGYDTQALADKLITSRFLHPTHHLFSAQFF
jgi:hypothetical protein